jgi:hypothetical protein
VSTIHIWLASEPSAISTSTKNYHHHHQAPFSHPNTATSGGGDASTAGSIRGRTPPPPRAPFGIAPVLNVGVPCLRGSTFPLGTFVVQPAVCVGGRWQPVGIISEKTHATVIKEVNKLWVEREQLIFRDKDVGPILFPDLIEEPTTPYIRKPKVVPVEKSEEVDERQAYFDAYGHYYGQEYRGEFRGENDEQQQPQFYFPDQQTNYYGNENNAYQSQYDPNGQFSQDPQQQLYYQQQQNQQGMMGYYDAQGQWVDTSGIPPTPPPP